MVLGGTRWDRKESPKSNLHVCGKDDTKIVVYNMERCTEKKENKSRRRTRTLVQFYYSTRPYDMNYLIYSEDKFSNFTCVKPS